MFITCIPDRGGRCHKDPPPTSTPKEENDNPLNQLNLQQPKT